MAERNREIHIPIRSAAAPSVNPPSSQRVSSTSNEDPFTTTDRQLFRHDNSDASTAKRTTAQLILFTTTPHLPSLIGLHQTIQQDSLDPLKGIVPLYHFNDCIALYRQINLIKQLSRNVGCIYLDFGTVGK